MYKALVACRAGMGSSMLLKIKTDQVIKENDFPIETEHGNLDSLIGYQGDLVITMSDLADGIREKSFYAVGIKSIVNKEEIKIALEEFLKTTE